MAARMEKDAVRCGICRTCKVSPYRPVVAARAGDLGLEVSRPADPRLSSADESAERRLRGLDVLDKTREGVDRLPHRRERHVPSLKAEPSEPSQRRSFGVRGLVLAHEEGYPERVLEVDGRQLGRGCANDREVPVSRALRKFP